MEGRGFLNLILYIECGVKQKSVYTLCPGLSFVNVYAGAWFPHDDDIRTLMTSTDTLESQVTMVKRFAPENFLKPIIYKCA